MIDCAYLILFILLILSKSLLNPVQVASSVPAFQVEQGLLHVEAPVVAAEATA